METRSQARNKALMTMDPSDLSPKGQRDRLVLLSQLGVEAAPSSLTKAETDSAGGAPEGGKKKSRPGKTQRERAKRQRSTSTPSRSLLQDFSSASSKDATPVPAKKSTPMRVSPPAPQQPQATGEPETPHEAVRKLLLKRMGKEKLAPQITPRCAGMIGNPWGFLHAVHVEHIPRDEFRGSPPLSTFMTTARQTLFDRFPCGWKGPYGGAPSKREQVSQRDAGRGFGLFRRT